MRTPLLKVWKDGKKDSERRNEKAFFTLVEYEKWKRDTPNYKAFNMKYYKGLGTSTSKEAKEYFRELDRHTLNFVWHADMDDEAIDLAFNKTKTDDRKQWINTYEE